jgi:hypothetical protein
MLERRSAPRVPEAGRAGRDEPTLQVQVSLKSRRKCDPIAPCRTCSRSARSRGAVASRHRRSASTRSGACSRPSGRLGSPSLPAAGAPADRVHRLRPADRAYAGRDRRGAREAAFGACADRPRLVASRAHVDVADRSANRRARAAESRAHRMHRLRLSLARPLQARQPRRPGRPPRARPPRLDRRWRSGLTREPEIRRSNRPTWDIEVRARYATSPQGLAKKLWPGTARVDATVLPARLGVATAKSSSGATGRGPRGGGPRSRARRRSPR